MNVACGKKFTAIEYVDELNKILGNNINPKFQKERKDDVKHLLADITRANKIFEFSYHIDFCVLLNMAI